MPKIITFGKKKQLPWEEDIEAKGESAQAPKTLKLRKAPMTPPNSDVSTSGYEDAEKKLKKLKIKRKE
jgi:hypothetical protein